MPAGLIAGVVRAVVGVDQIDAVLRAESSGAVLDSLCSGIPREITIDPTIKATMLHARRCRSDASPSSSAGDPVYQRGHLARVGVFYRGLRA